MGGAAKAGKFDKIANRTPTVFDPNEVDPDRNRSSHIKHLVADRKLEEQLRKKLV